MPHTHRFEMRHAKALRASLGVIGHEARSWMITARGSS